MTTPNLARWRAFHSLIQPRHWGIECGDDGEDIVVAPSLSEETAKFVAETYNKLLERLSRERDTGVPEGWQLVPKEPTEEMMDALYKRPGGLGFHHPLRIQCFRDALAAAPQPPTTDKGTIVSDCCEACGKTVWGGDDGWTEDGACYHKRCMPTPAPQPPTVSELPPFESAGLRGAKLVAERELGIERQPTTVSTQGWQDISSAPKDGSEVIGWRSDCGPILVRWTSCAEFMTDAECEASGMDEDSLHKEDWFYSDFLCGGRFAPDEYPTHWMPLPSDPGETTTPVPDLSTLTRERDQAREALARTERNRDMWKDQCARQANQLSAINELPQECVNSLTHQRQIDMDGCEVGVSRQAVDEIHAALKRARSVLNPEKEEKA